MLKTKISENEICFHSLSFTDPNGRLFKWNQELYRAVPDRQAEFFNNLVQQGIIQTLIDKSILVDTQVSPFFIDGHNLIFKHHTIPFVSYPQEWCDAMLKEAALLHLDLCLELDNYQMTTHDAHPLNILFDGNKPIFIDLGSITHYSIESFPSLWPRHDQFCRSFTYPLQLMELGHARIARWLLQDYDHGVRESDFQVLVRGSKSDETLSKLTIIWLKELIKHVIPRQGRVFAKTLKNSAISAFREKNTFHSCWKGLFLEMRSDIEKIQFRDELSVTFKLTDQPKNTDIVESLLGSLNPTSVLDINSLNNLGQYGQLAASHGYQTLVFDSNESKLRHLHHVARAKNLYLLPILMDIFSPSYGFYSDWFSSPSDRLSCDMVIALEILDQLVFDKELQFDTITNRLCAFTKQWLLLEFISSEVSVSAATYPEMLSRCSWYSLENLIFSLELRFNNVEIIGSNNDKSRVLLLCSSKK